MIRCIAIDDEPLALTQISGYIEKTPFLRLTASCRNAFEAMEAMEEGADLLFVDINMPDLNGLDFVRSLNPRPLVIFTTAYSDYAIEGFRVDALDYLLKPIGYSDFLRAAEKAYKQHSLLHRSVEDVPGGLRTLFVKSGYKTVQIEIDKIIYIESQSEYVKIHMEGCQPVMSLGSLKSYEDNLPAGAFMRIHRSYIVKLDKITAVDRKHIIVGPDVRIPIGSLYEEQFRSYLSEHSIETS